MLRIKQLFKKVNNMEREEIKKLAEQKQSEAGFNRTEFLKIFIWCFFGKKPRMSNRYKKISKCVF